jgi:hypothetical protein
MAIGSTAALKNLTTASFGSPLKVPRFVKIGMSRTVHATERIGSALELNAQQQQQRRAA